MAGNCSQAGAGGTTERNYVMNINTNETVAHEFTGNGANQTLNGATIVTDDQWHHLAISYDGTTSRVFVDGILDAEAVMPVPQTNTAPVRFGRAGGTGGARANGIIDEVIILNVAYEEAEIAQLMAGLGRLTTVDAIGRLPTLWGVIKLR